MKFKTMKFRNKYEQLLADNKRMNTKLIDLNSKLLIYEQKILSIESAFDLSQKLVQHLKTENQLLRSSSVPDIFSLAIPLGPSMSNSLAITDGSEMGQIRRESTDQSADNPNSGLFKSDLIAIQYEKEIKELREECDLLNCLPLDQVVIRYEDQLNANSHLSGVSDSEYGSDEQMDVDFDVISTKMSETSERNTESKCKYCGKRFHELSVLDDHILLHKSSDEKQIRCAEDFCGHQFESKHDLKIHLKKIHRNEQKNTKFSSLKAKFQMKSSQNKSLFDCKQCNQEFDSMQSLRLHQKSVHKIVSTFKCKFSGCEKIFEKSCELRAHEEIHRKQKSTIEFKQTPNKTTVQQETNGSQAKPEPVIKRPYACTFEGCQASYVHKTSLKKHEEKCHPNGVLSVMNSVQTSETPGVVTPVQSIGSKLDLLELFFTQQQQHTQF